MSNEQLEMGFMFCLSAKRIVLDTDDHAGSSLLIGFRQPETKFNERSEVKGKIEALSINKIRQTAGLTK